MMLVQLGLGLMIFLGLIIGLLHLTRREEPYGCMLVFVIFFLVILAGAVIPQLALAQ